MITHQEPGVWWHEAPLPPLEHDCFAWSWGTIGDLMLVERCPCGALRRTDTHGKTGWLSVNCRRAPGVSA